MRALIAHAGDDNARWPMRSEGIDEEPTAIGCAQRRGTAAAQTILMPLSSLGKCRLT
jgi:hypothetical protein